jgi:hypothetical protein
MGLVGETIIICAHTFRLNGITMSSGTQFSLFYIHRNTQASKAQYNINTMF